MKKFFLGTFVVFLFIVLPLAAFKFFQIRTAMAEGAKMGPPVTAVSTVIAKTAPWTSVFKTAGTIKGAQSSVLSSEAAGRISKINVSEGQSVEKGTIILELDSAVEEGEFRAAVAQMDLAEKDLIRSKSLFASKAISAEEFDKAKLSYESLKAAADALKAHLERRKVVAPYKAKVGVIRVNEGDYIKEGIEIVAIENDESLYAVFSLNQETLMSLKNSTRKDVKVIVSPVGSSLPPIITTLSSVDPIINNNTKTALGKAFVPTSDIAKLVSGMSVGVSIELSENKNVIAIPTSSISFAPFGDSVYLVNPSAGTNEDGSPKPKTVKQTFIKVLESRGDLSAVITGLTDGQEVVSSGTFKLFPDAPVTINNNIKPGEDLNPTPANS